MKSKAIVALALIKYDNVHFCFRIRPRNYMFCLQSTGVIKSQKGRSAQICLKKGLWSRKIKLMIFLGLFSAKSSAPSLEIFHISLSAYTSS